MRRIAVPLNDWLLFPGLVLLAIACTSPATDSVPDFKAPASEECAVQVVTRREDDTTVFLVENRELCEVTVSFEFELVNLKASVPLPCTASFPPGQVTRAFSLAPVDPGADWAFTYTNYYKLGAAGVRHDDRCVYELPYRPGGPVEVTQAYNGHFSHTGPIRYAIDWRMPEGTLVCAARAGLVVRTKDDSDRGGASLAYDGYNNYVLIRHSDGTLGQYCHLQKGGVLVKPGQTVAAGQPIARSGNTGFSTGPHLHFCVYQAITGREFASLPVKFRTAEAPALTLLAGRTYQAADDHFTGGGSPPGDRSVTATTVRHHPGSLGAASLK